MSLGSVTSSLVRTINRMARPLLEAGVGNPLPIGSGPVLVESIGRRSGEPRATPLLSVRLGDTLAVSTVRPRSDWVANLDADPRGRVRLFGRTRDVTVDVRRLAWVRVAVLRLDPDGGAGS